MFGNKRFDPEYIGSEAPNQQMVIKPYNRERAGTIQIEIDNLETEINDMKGTKTIRDYLNLPEDQRELAKHHPEVIKFNELVEQKTQKDKELDSLKELGTINVDY